jgi:hypothetical protein
VSRALSRAALLRRCADAAAVAVCGMQAARGTCMRARDACDRAEMTVICMLTCATPVPSRVVVALRRLPFVWCCCHVVTNGYGVAGVAEHPG